MATRVDEAWTADFSPVVALACDLAMCWLDHLGSKESCLLLASAPIYVREMQARWPGRLMVAAEDQALQRGAALWLAGHPQARVLDGADEHAVRCEAAVWSVPRRASFEQRLELLDAAGVESLVIFGPGPLAKCLGPARPGWLAGQGLAHALPKLSKLGFQTVRQCSLGDDVALLRAGMARAAGRAGQPYLRDRWEAAFRLRLTVPLRPLPGLLDACMLSRGGKWQRR